MNRIKPLERMLTPIVHNGDVWPPRGVRKMPVLINQRLAERGFRSPWLWTAAQCRDYWAEQDENSGLNRPSEYATKDQGITRFLTNFWQPEVLPNMSILEIGCNAGANLHGLYQRGYRNQIAVEINPVAIDELHRSFPHLDPKIAIGAAEDLLPTMASDSVDVVFTTGVLLHVHPSSNTIFNHMARIARRYLCVVECETATLPYIFARNYRRVFTRLGCAHLRSALLNPGAYPDLSHELYGYVARLLVTPSQS